MKSVQMIYRIIAKGSLITMLLFSMSASATTITPLMLSGGASVVTHVLAHPPVNGDCASCHPDVMTMPRIN